MPKKSPATTEAPAADESDARFVPVVHAFAKTEGFSCMESKSRAMRGLMLNGKSFGMSTHGRLILKLNEQRAVELITVGTAAQFYPSPGKPMKGWVEITNAKADWVALAKEAQALAAATGKKPKPKSKGLGAAVQG
jgi:hypothetical protein